ncbi:bifunctional 5,10-methylenetetrahydrofolate dehydrogenase/5,10-methenyltetrahydrofolate cyclohydrolase [Flindersiella endophytica]
MTAMRLDGKAPAAAIRAEVASAVAARPTPPKLAVVVVSGDEASAWYVRTISNAAAKVGVDCEVIEAEPDGSVIRATLRQLNSDHAVHGIVLQSPLPAGLPSAQQLAGAIDAAKDVDGANPLSLGRLAAGQPAFAPATAAAVLALLDHHEIDLAGRHAVVVGRSTVVGKPVAHLLLDRNATVTVAHSRTSDLAAITRQADVLVVAAGRAGLITDRHVRPGAYVIDVGTNPTPEGKLVGDVDAASVEPVAGGLSPVPGGVGPVTTAVLLRHTVTAAVTAPGSRASIGA